MPATFLCDDNNDITYRTRNIYCLSRSHLQQQQLCPGCTIRYTENTIEYNRIRSHSPFEPNIVPSLGVLQILFRRHSGTASTERHDAASYIACSAQYRNDATRIAGYLIPWNSTNCIRTAASIVKATTRISNRYNTFAIRHTNRTSACKSYAQYKAHDQLNMCTVIAVPNPTTLAYTRNTNL